MAQTVGTGVIALKGEGELVFALNTLAPLSGNQRAIHWGGVSRVLIGMRHLKNSADRIDRAADDIR